MTFLLTVKRLHSFKIGVSPFPAPPPKKNDSAVHEKSGSNWTKPTIQVDTPEVLRKNPPFFDWKNECYTLPETSPASQFTLENANGWFRCWKFPFGARNAYFQGCLLLVSGSVLLWGKTLDRRPIRFLSDLLFLKFCFFQAIKIIKIAECYHYRWHLWREPLKNKQTNQQKHTNIEIDGWIWGFLQHLQRSNLSNPHVNCTSSTASETWRTAL